MATDRPAAAGEGASGLRLAFYGDDFTGSTDALEVLAFAGLRCALFLQVPSAETLAQLGPFDAIGVAGDSRAMSPAEMQDQLPALFARLAALPVPLVHYKVCSTFDSSPSVGSIGRVMDLARAAFGDAPIPVVAATPALGRYCCFGHLFARSGTDGQVHRLDRHPIMGAHPMTPMHEADLAVHLGAQTALRIAKFTLPLFALGRDAIERELDREFARAMAAAPDAIVFDGTTADHLTEVGRWLDLQQRAEGRLPRFAVGSSGLEYALTQWWRENGTLPALARDYAAFDAVPQVLAVSGSASSLSALQIDAALEAGFVDLAADAAALVAEATGPAALATLAARAIDALRAGRSVMLHTARGPHDPRIDAMIAALVADGGRSHRSPEEARQEARHEGGRRLGQCLGEVVDRVLRAVPLRRLLLSGGDTSSQITQRLAPDALQVEARLAPGAPLCRVLSRQDHLRGLQIALKGGQMGQPDYFLTAMRGSR